MAEGEMYVFQHKINLKNGAREQNGGQNDSVC